MTKRKQHKTQKLLWIAGGILACAVAVFVFLFIFDARPMTHDEVIEQAAKDPTILDKDQSQSEKDDINKNTTGDDVKDVLDKKEENTKPVEQHQDGKKKAEVLVTTAYVEDGKIHASAMVTNLVEEAGQCTFNYTSPSGRKISDQQSSLPNAKNTPCSVSVVAASESGKWQVSVEYNSEKSRGQSQILEFAVE